MAGEHAILNGGMLPRCAVATVESRQGSMPLPAVRNAHRWNQEAASTALPMRIIFVPQTAQVPWVAGLPFFNVTGLGSLISRFSRHLTQYASTR